MMDGIYPLGYAGHATPATVWVLSAALAVEGRLCADLAGNDALDDTGA